MQREVMLVRTSKFKVKLSSRENGYCYSNFFSAVICVPCVARCALVFGAHEHLSGLQALEWREKRDHQTTDSFLPSSGICCVHIAPSLTSRDREREIVLTHAAVDCLSTYMTVHVVVHKMCANVWIRDKLEHRRRL